MLWVILHTLYRDFFIISQNEKWLLCHWTPLGMRWHLDSKGFVSSWKNVYFFHKTYFTWYLETFSYAWIAKKQTNKKKLSINLRLRFEFHLTGTFWSPPILEIRTPWAFWHIFFCLEWVLTEKWPTSFYSHSAISILSSSHIESTLSPHQRGMTWPSSREHQGTAALLLTPKQAMCGKWITQMTEINPENVVYTCRDHGAWRLTCSSLQPYCSEN